MLFVRKYTLQRTIVRSGDEENATVTADEPGLSEKGGDGKGAETTSAVKEVAPSEASQSGEDNEVAEETRKGA